jgi:ATP-dependent helicase/nuclease subunit A
MTHPIVERMQPSAEQLPAILRRERDLLVTAGAGSGKTLTLVARYLALLAEGLSLRSIVAITFTRKAAREMRNRVRRQVDRYRRQDDLAPDEREAWGRVYVQLDAARISTIHTLCGELLRAQPAEAGVDPSFAVLDEAQTTLLKREAVERALAWAADDAESSRLFVRLPESALHATLTTLLNARLDAAPLLDPERALWQGWERLVREPLEAFVRSPLLQDALAEFQGLAADGTLQRAESEGDKLAPYLRTLLEIGAQTLSAADGDDWCAVSELLPSFRRNCVSYGKKENWPAGPKATLKELRDVFDVLPTWATQGDLALDRELAGLMPALSKLFTQLVGLYDGLRAERNALDFDDLEEHAMRLLEEHPDVRGRWQREIAAILVDEFQDTNPRQFRLVELLNGDRGRAFYVGDAKQSIYRFRGADVRLFCELQQRAGTGADRAPATLELRTSYRAHAGLLKGLNALLAPVLGDQAEDKDLREFRIQAGPGFQPPYIELHLAVGTKSGEQNALEQAGRALAARLHTLLHSGLQVQERDGCRPLEEGDIAILCRSSDAFGAYENALEEYGIPFLTVSGREFFTRSENRDLLNMLRAVADPTDDLALAGLLRSAAFGVSDPSLYLLCAARDDGGTLWDVVRQTPADLEAEQAGCVSRAAAIVADLHERCGRTAVADVLKALIDRTDYRAGLRACGQARAARNVGKLLSDAQTSGIVSVGEFLEYVTALRGAGAREGEARATAEHAVQIMSVHAAKGLEFPIVVIGDVGARPKTHNGPLLDEHVGVVLPIKGDDKRTSAIYGWAREREAEAEASESARLLYVAATRAREMLLLSGCAPADGKGALRLDQSWLQQLGTTLGLAAACPELQEDGDCEHLLMLSVGDLPVACHIYEEAWRPPALAASGRPRAQQPPLVEPVLLRPVAVARDEAEEQEPDRGAEPGQREWRVVPHSARPSAPEWVVGQLVHEALAAWRFPEEGFRAWAEARARTLGVVIGHAVRDAAERTETLLLRLRAHALSREVEAADERLHEVPYSVVGNDGRTDARVIDLLFRKGEVWTILEYKTNRAADQAAARRLMRENRYDVQARCYLRAAEDLLGVRPQLVICWLDCGARVWPMPFDDTDEEPD